MPSPHEVLGYIRGLWLLIKGDARGLSAFDISDRGVLGSFWAFVWALPAIAVIWHSRRLDHAQTHLQNDENIQPSLADAAAVELAQWLVPTLAIAVIAIVLGLRPLTRTLIITRNWFSVPLVYASAVIAALDNFLPTLVGDDGFLAKYGTIPLAIFVLIAALILNWRLLWTIAGGPAWKRLTILVFTIATEVTFVSWLETSLGIDNPW